MQVTRGGAISPVRGDEGGESDLAGIGKEEGDLYDPRKPFFSPFFRLLAIANNRSLDQKASASFQPSSLVSVADRALGPVQELRELTDARAQKDMALHPPRQSF